MSERTSSTITIAATKRQVMRVIADLEHYPEWAGSVKSVEVHERDSDDRPSVATFVLDAGVVKDTYTLEYSWQNDTLVTWTLREAQMLTAMDGSYRLEESSGSTEVEYLLALDLKIPMIGLLRRKAEKVITDTALNELKRRVEAEG